MLANYIKTALRNLIRHKGYSAINIAGLAVGMAVFMLVLLWVKDALSYDRFHKDAERIFRIAQIHHPESPDQRSEAPLTPAALGPALVNQYAAAEMVTRISITDLTASSKMVQFFEEQVFMVDENFFEMFSFVLLKGDPERVLTAPNTVVLTETAAKKYFGSEEALGKVLLIHGDPWEVSGIAQDIPSHSHFTFNILNRSIKT